MPFQSRSQMRTCFGKHDSRWDCKSWIKETDSVCCLPERKGMPSKCRTKRKGEKIIGPVQKGPRGGKFFMIEERDKKGKICEIKVYV